MRAIMSLSTGISLSVMHFASANHRSPRRKSTTAPRIPDLMRILTSSCTRRIRTCRFSFLISSVQNASERIHRKLVSIMIATDQAMTHRPSTRPSTHVLVHRFIHTDRSHFGSSCAMFKHHASKRFAQTSCFSVRCFQRS